MHIKPSHQLSGSSALSSSDDLSSYLTVVTLPFLLFDIAQSPCQKRLTSRTPHQLFFCIRSTKNHTAQTPQSQITAKSIRSVIGFTQDVVANNSDLQSSSSSCTTSVPRVHVSLRHLRLSAPLHFVIHCLSEKELQGLFSLLCFLPVRSSRVPLWSASGPLPNSLSPTSHLDLES